MESEARFAGFPRAGLTFLRGLEKNNERAWFNERKEIYKSEVSAPLEALIVDLAERLRRARIPLAPNPRNAAFRIYRDVRFSPDKRPYKSHVSFVFHRGGDTSQPGVLYVHVDPKEPFVAAGFYHPEKDQLANLREAIVANPKGFARLVDTLRKAGAPLLEEDALKRVPPAYRERSAPEIDDALRLKSIVAQRPIPVAALATDDLLGRIVRFAADAKPLLDWGWRSVA